MFSHDHCGCSKAPLIGARYRRRSIDPMTGAELGWRYYTVTDVDEASNEKVFCRRAHLISDSGGSIKPQVQTIFAEFEAIDNVVPIFNDAH